MSKSLDRMRDERIKALIKQVELRRESDIAEASRRGRLLQEEKPLPDVPLHKRGFGVVDEDAP
jgi:hypothetical protein